MLEMSEHHRDVAVESRGVSTRNGHVDVDALVHAATPDTLEDALAHLPPADVHREVLSCDDGCAEVYSHYPVARSVHQATTDAGFLVVTPAVHVDGYEYWEVLTDADGLRDGLTHLREHAEVRVERVADAPARARQQRLATQGLVARLADTMSDRQLEVLSRAVEAGYYDWPRGRGLKELASTLGISGPTCLEHIRRAEGRLVPALVEEIERIRAAARVRHT